MDYGTIAYALIHVQWNLSNPDTTGPEESVLIRELSIFLGLKCTHSTWRGGKGGREGGREGGGE